MINRINYISVDDHIVEPPNLWTDRVDKRWGARIPHVRRNSDGADEWVIDDRVIPLSDVLAIGAVLPDRAARVKCWEDVPAHVYTPSERLHAMDADGVSTSVLYPMVAGVAGQRLGALSDPDLELACARAYNDWLIDEWTSVSKRFVAQCVIPLSRPADAAAEIRRAVARGHRGVVMPGNPALVRTGLPHVNESDYDPIWEACQELKVPVCFHAGSTSSMQMPPYKDYSPPIIAALEAMTRPVSSTFLLGNLLFSGILTRYPGLKVVFSESTLAWGAYTIESADHQFERQRYDMAGRDVIPSDLFHRQCYLTGWYDSTGARTRKVIGVENMLWSSNFPQATSTWPNASETIEQCFFGVPQSERQAILVDNAAKLYGITA